MGADPKRGSERIELLGGLSGVVMMPQPTVVRQMGTGGMEIETAFPLHLDSLHDFKLTLGDRPVVLKGRVVHSHISDVDQDIVRYRSGIEFVEPSERVAAVIADFLQGIRQARQR